MAKRHTDGSGFIALNISKQAAVATRRATRGFARGFADLANQAQRAADSVALNLAEDSSAGGDPPKGERWCSGREKGDRIHHFRIALGSAKEAATAVELLREGEAIDRSAGNEALALLDRACALCWRLANPR